MPVLARRAHVMLLMGLAVCKRWPRNNQLATHFRTYFQMAAGDAAALAGSFGLMQLGWTCGLCCLFARWCWYVLVPG